MADKHCSTYDEIKSIFEHWGIPYTEERAFLSDDKVLVVTNKAGMNVELYFSEDYYGASEGWRIRNVYIEAAGVSVSDVVSIIIFHGSMHNDIVCCDERKHHVVWIQIPDVV